MVQERPAKSNKHARVMMAEICFACNARATGPISEGWDFNYWAAMELAISNYGMKIGDLMLEAVISKEILMNISW